MPTVESKYSTVLFDFDGTLTPSLPLWVQAFRFTFAQFDRHMTDAEIIKSCFYRAWEHLVEEFQLPCPLEFTKFMKLGLTNAFEEAVLFPGVTETLNELANQNINLGIVTSSRRSIVNKFLTRHSLQHHFLTVVSEEDILQHKPHPEPVLLALARLNSPASNCVLIGDSSADMLAAEAAGIHRGLFLPNEHSAFYSFEALRGHRPEFIFHDYNQLAANLFTQVGVAPSPTAYLPS